MIGFLLLIQAASITGTVRDGASGEPLSGAFVAVVDLDRTAVTDTNGTYRLAGLPAGSHRLLVRRIGYAPRRMDVLVPADGAVDLGIALSPDPVLLRVVDVGANGGGDRGADRGAQRPPLIADRALSTAEIREHPLLAEPDVLQALGGVAVALRPESPSGLHVRGGESDQIAFLLDGLPIFSPYRIVGAFSAWNPDALAGVELEAASESWDALSGVVTATTRTPGERHRVQAGLSSTQLRATVDGPVGSDGAGYLWSFRTGFPGFPAPTSEASYMRGEAGDWLAKVEAPLAAGRVQLVGYESANEIDAAASPSRRHAFGWGSRTIGFQWLRRTATGLHHARAWVARQEADALWYPSDSVIDRLWTRRRDLGLSTTLEKRDATGWSRAGIRLQYSRTAYHAAGARYESGAPLGAVFAERTHRLGSAGAVVAGVSGTGSTGGFRFSPRAMVRWSPRPALAVSAGYTRLHQFSQSLRNPESVVGMVFPADLYVGAGRSGIPVARTDQGIAAVELRPRAGWRLSGQGWIRSFRGLVLVARQSAGPFATGPVSIGSGGARGFAIEAAAESPHATAVASYRWERVRLDGNGTRYSPDHAAAHTVDIGITARPSARLSFQVGATGRFGRRTTGLASPLEWEACNLTDLGCEFAGSPRSTPDSLGGTPLPGYVRVDVGVRKRWPLRIAGREAQLAVFGTMTNVLGQTNLLTMAPDPVTGSSAGVTMRPRAPLVLGIDWSF